MDKCKNKKKNLNYTHKNAVLLLNVVVVLSSSIKRHVYFYIIR